MSTSISIGNALQGLLAAGSFWTFLGGVIGAAITYVILTSDPAGGRNVRNIAAACCARRAGATGAGDSIPPSPTRALPSVTDEEDTPPSPTHGTLRAVANGDGGTGLGGERGGVECLPPPTRPAPATRLIRATSLPRTLTRTGATGLSPQTSSPRPTHDELTFVLTALRVHPCN